MTSSRPALQGVPASRLRHTALQGVPESLLRQVPSYPLALNASEHLLEEPKSRATHTNASERLLEDISVPSVPALQLGSPLLTSCCTICKIYLENDDCACGPCHDGSCLEGRVEFGIGLVSVRCASAYYNGCGSFLLIIS